MMNGSWVVVVEGESRTRTLNVLSTNQEADGSAIIDSEYGWSDGRKSSLKAKLGKNASNRDELTFTTGAGSKITASLIQPGVFEGRIVNGTDYDKKITIANSDASKQLGLVLQKPGPDVPPSCAAFFGSWKGYWTQGSFPEMLIHITEVKPSCVAKYFYYPDTKYTTNLEGSAEIQDGKISFLCNKVTGGTCAFTLRGDEFWASYSNPSGGVNNGVFKKR
jgi:hypothetical protein